MVGAPQDDDGGSDSGSVYVFSSHEKQLLAFSESVSLSSGGVQHLGLAAGEEDAGALYFLASTGSGTCPGSAFGSVIVPLNLDLVTTYSIAHANQPPFANTFGVLDAEGQSHAAIHIPAGTSAALAGLTLHHAFVVLDPVTAVVLSASNPVPLAFEP